MDCVCGYPEASCSHFEDNPNFSSPEGFFWLWERVKEKEWWTRFFDVYGRIHNGYPVINISLINPLKFRAALMEFWGIKEM